MTTLVIEGRRITVDDRFLNMSPHEQNRTVKEIAEQLRITPQLANDDSHDPAADDATGALADTVGQFGERFNRGLYSFANFPTDLANMATGALGVDYRFKRPLEAIAPSLDQSIMDVPEAQSAAGRVAGTVGEFMGANALPGGGLLAAAPRLAAATQQATGLGGQAVNRMAAGISAAPALQQPENWHHLSVRVSVLPWPRKAERAIPGIARGRYPGSCRHRHDAHRSGSRARRR